MQDPTNPGESPQSRRSFLKFAVVGGIGLGVGTYLGIRRLPIFRQGFASDPDPEATATSSRSHSNTTPNPQWGKMDAAQRWNALTEEHPAGETLRRLFPADRANESGTGQKTGLTRADYLPLITGNVRYFLKCQDGNGAIIDPFSNKERQYSTPAFALAAATVATAGGQTDLLEPAVKAMTFALNALAHKTTADNHPDFYIPMLVHTYSLLKDKVPPETAEYWQEQFYTLVPEKAYRDVGGRGNWNAVNLSGEWMRRKHNLVDPRLSDAQEAYGKTCIARQVSGPSFTRFGMYAEAHTPLAYDAFPRLWLEDMVAEEAYNGSQYDRLLSFLCRGGLSTLLLLSPTGEWANGGRSAQHQWNEAQVAVICEINAQRWKQWGRPDLAGAFKRSAHLALSSVQRWQRPSGELWIVKNHGEPEQRFGFERYSFHSQYNLLAAAMLSIAYQRADDAIQEAPTPGERGSYVFDVRETFHKVCAAGGGAYALVETGADAHYDSTGLMRYHQAGAPYSCYSGTPGANSALSPGNPAKIAMTPGIAWQEQATSPWLSLASFEGLDSSKGDNLVKKVAVANVKEDADAARFTLRYDLQGSGARPVEEEYAVSASGLEVTSRLPTGGGAPHAARVQFPALVSDGAADTKLAIQGSQATITHEGTRLTWEVVSPQGAKLKLDGPRVPTHNGYVQALVADLPAGTGEVKWRVIQEKAS